MPNIKISDEQAQALARGENITIEPVPAAPVGRPIKNALIRGRGTYEGHLYFVKRGFLHNDDFLETFESIHLRARYGSTFPLTTNGGPSVTFRPARGRTGVRLGRAAFEIVCEKV